MEEELRALRQQIEDERRQREDSEELLHILKELLQMLKKLLQKHYDSPLAAILNDVTNSACASLL